MRRFLSPLLVLVFAAAAFGCNDDTPFCGAPRDATGRLVPYCGNPRSDPVCNLPGEEAHFEMGAMGLVLAGGELAMCDGDDEIVCPPGTEGEPFCITDPEL